MKSLFYLLLVLTVPAYAQVSVQVTNPPPTLVEAFAATKDAVIIKGVSKIGTLEGQVSFPVDVRVEELINVQTSNRVFGVVLRTKMQNQTVVNYIDYEELEPLLAAIHYIVQTDHNITGLEHFNAYFQTKGGFTVSKYSADNRNYTALKTTLLETEPNIMDLPSISQFETLMVAAKTKLDAIKRGDR
jgi:hypothetical protein